MKGPCKMVRYHEKLNQDGQCVQYKSEELLLQRICSGVWGNHFGVERTSSRLSITIQNYLSMCLGGTGGERDMAVIIASREEC